MFDEKFDLEQAKNGVFFVVQAGIPFKPFAKKGLFLARLKGFDDFRKYWLVDYLFCLQRNDSAYLEGSTFCFKSECFNECRRATDEEIKRFTNPQKTVSDDYDGLFPF